MTRAEFRSLVTQMTRVHGPQYVEADSDVNKVLDQALAAWTKASLYLWSDRIVFAPVADQDTYRIDVPSAVFTLSTTQVVLAEVHHVFFDGSGLFDLDGHYGPSDVRAMRVRYPAYVSSAMYPSSTPLHWWATRRELTLWPAPSAAALAAATGPHRVSAFYAHPAVASDNTVLLVADEHCELAAMEAAIRLMRPFAADIGEEKMRRLQAELEAVTAKMAAEHRVQVAPATIGQSRFAHDWVCL